MATHSSVLAWRIPGIGEPGGLPIYGAAQSQTQLKWPSNSSSTTILEDIKRIWRNIMNNFISINSVLNYSKKNLWETDYQNWLKIKEVCFILHLFNTINSYLRNLPTKKFISFKENIIFSKINLLRKLKGKP